MINVTNDFRNLNDINSPQLMGVWHLCYYIPKSRGNDELSESILRFKNNDPNISMRWATWAFYEIKKLNIKFDYVLRALGSRELVINIKNKPLDIIGNYLHDYLGFKYVPEILEKTNSHDPLHNVSTAYERRIILNNLYQIADINIDLNFHKVLIIDDVCTSRTTISEILKVLGKKWPNGEFFFFFLARTENNIELNYNICLPEIIHPR